MAGPFKLKSGNNPMKKGFFGIKINPEGLIGRLTTKAKILSKTRDFSKTEMQDVRDTVGKRTVGGGGHWPTL